MIYVGIVVTKDINTCTVINENGKEIRYVVFNNDTTGFEILNKTIRGFGSKKTIFIGYVSYSGTIKDLKKYLTDKKYLSMQIQKIKVESWRKSSPGHLNCTDKVNSRMAAEWMKRFGADILLSEFEVPLEDEQKT